MDWLNLAFNEQTVAWLLVSSIGGGVVGAIVTFVFDDFIRYNLASRRERSRIYLRYRNPLLQRTISLERQINNILRNRGEHWLEDSYFRLSVFYRFGTFLYWVYRIEIESGFLDIGGTRRAQDFSKHLYAPFSGLSSIRRYGLDPDTAIPRDILRAIGEEMATASSSAAEALPMGFAAFSRKYEEDAQFRYWFERLGSMLSRLATLPADADVERMVIAGAHLTRLANFLDPKGAFSTKKIDNLDLIGRPEVQALLVKDGFPVNYKTTDPSGSSNANPYSGDRFS